MLLSLLLTALPAQAEQVKGGKGFMKLEISSGAFGNGQTIPKQYTADGKNVSPPLTWNQPPSGTKSLALICDDPDAPVGTWVHWVVYGLSPQSSGLAEGVLAQASVANQCQQGVNSFHKIGYGGPSPPPGKPHRYFFKLFALDSDPAFKGPATAKQLEEAMRGHTLAAGEIMGTYGR
jgi:Raf kinase inhibitor-like YbhB/YbcL family protein